MKLHPFIAHTSIFFVGLFLATGYFLFKAIPNTAQYVRTDIEFIDLPNSDGNTHYYKVLEDYFLGDLYLRDPLYFFQRDKGHKIMAKLANLGYTPASDSLFYYHFHKAFGSKVLKAKTDPKLVKIKEYDKARKWAILSAEQGSLIPIYTLLSMDNPPPNRNMTDDIKVLEQGAKTSTTPVYAKWLGKYYSEHSQPQKAAYWAEQAKTIEQSPDAYTGHQTRKIKPWRGY